MCICTSMAYSIPTCRYVILYGNSFMRSVASGAAVFAYGSRSKWFMWEALSRARENGNDPMMIASTWAHRFIRWNAVYTRNRYRSCEHWTIVLLSDVFSLGPVAADFQKCFSVRDQNALWTVPGSLSGFDMSRIMLNVNFPWTQGRSNLDRRLSNPWTFLQ